MSRGPARCALACALALAALVSGCGKKGPVRPPEGEAASYTYPRTYPDPAAVLPGEDEPVRRRAAPRRAGGITTFPDESRSRTTYDSGPAQ